MFFQHTLTSEKIADIRFAHQLTRRLAGVYKQGVVQGLYPGGNVQVAIAYENNTPTAIATPVISTHHAPSLSLRDLRYQLIEYVMKLAHAYTLQRWRSGEMPFVIAEPCIDVLDQACVSVCPVACIHFDAGKDRKLYIDPNECIDCGACEPVCPVKAIYPDLDLPYKWAKYEEIDALWYRDKEAARAMVDAVKARA